MTIAPEYFVPARRTILAITQSNPMFVFIYGNHGIGSGAIVRFFIPISRGMQQLNGVTAEVAAAGALDVLGFLIDSTDFDTYIPLAPPDPKFHQAFGQILVIGEDALILDYAITNNNNITPET